MAFVDKKKFGFVSLSVGFAVWLLIYLVKFGLVIPQTNSQIK